MPADRSSPTPHPHTIFNARRQVVTYTSPSHYIYCQPTGRHLHLTRSLYPMPADRSTPTSHPLTIFNASRQVDTYTSLSPYINASRQVVTYTSPSHYMYCQPTGRRLHLTLSLYPMPADRSTPTPHPLTIFNASRQVDASTSPSHYRLFIASRQNEVRL